MTATVVRPVPVVVASDPVPDVTRVEKASAKLNAYSSPRTYIFRPRDLNAGVQLHFQGLSAVSGNYIVRGIYGQFRKTNKPADALSQIAIQNVEDGTMRRISAGYICNSARWSILA